MAGKLSFAIAINLLTENFKRGTNQVKAGFRAMQMQVLTFAAALGAGGLGLSDLVTRFIDVARETNRVSTALKNVSGSMGQYADNQRYLLSIAQKYGLEINALTGNFAKFTAAAAISGMSMTEQRKVFESVSRACTAFGMSADDSNGVFLALSQMMSKGKISSEELRSQMGERLPVALQAMAKAAGVSVAGLDKLLKQGKLMSADVLPKFADALNEMIPNVDTDNLETSVNRLKNVFTELVNGTDAQSKYKALIDWLTGAIQGAADNIKNIVIGVVAVISGLVANAVVKTVKGWGAAASQLAAFSETADNRMLSSTARRVAAEQALEKAKLQQALAVGSQKIVAAEMVAKAEIKLAAATAAEVKAKEVAKAAAAQAAAVTSSTAWGKACSVVKIGAAKVAASFTAMWSTFAPMVIVSAIVGVIGYFKNMREEAERVRKVFSDYKREAEGVTHTPEIIQLKVLQDLYNKAGENSKLKEKYQNRIVELLGGELKKNKDINDAVRERIKLLEATAKVDFYTRKKVEAEDKIQGLYNKRGGEKAFNFQYQNALNNRGILNFGENPIIGEFEEAVNLRRIIADSDAQLLKYTEYVEKNKPVVRPIIDPDDKKEKKTPLEKQQDSYNKQFEELGAELEIGKLTQSEYNKALAELNIKMFAQAKGTGDKDVLESEYFKARKSAAEAAVKNMPQLNANVELEKVQKEYGYKLAELKGQVIKNVLSQKEFNEKVVELSVESSKAAAGIKGIGNSADGFITAMMINAKLLSVKKPKKEYDATYDYKKTAPGILSDKLNLAKDYAKQLQEEAKATGAELEEALTNAIAGVPSLEEALKIATIKEDVKNLNKELSDSLYSGVKDIASGADRVVSAFQNLNDVMNDVDSTEWEKIMAIWSALTNVVDSFLSVAKMIENITELTNKLTNAKQTEAAIDTQTTATKVANTAIGATADITAAGVKKATATQEVQANTSVAASEAGKGAAKLPFPWNIIAIGGAIAAAIAAFSAIPKFATGGIYTGGTASGDKGLARLNKGEMILNQGQQSNLFNAIDSGRLGGGSHVRVSGDVKLKGSDLYLSLDNYKKKTGKK